MEESKENRTEIIVIFKNDFATAIYGKNSEALKERNELNDLLQSYEATIEKLFTNVEAEYAGMKDMELYYVAYTNKEPEELMQKLLDLNFVDAAYIKSSSEDPGM